MSTHDTMEQEIDGALLAVIQEMEQAAGNMVQHLEAERAALLMGDTAALERVSHAKQQMMANLEQLDGERLQLVPLAPPNPDVEACWRRVLDHLRTCQDYNRRNGTLVGQRLRQVQQALTLLKGDTSAGQGVYGRAGHLETVTKSNRLASV